MFHMKEIGSEFNEMNIESGTGIQYPQEGILVFSGRTAIEMVIKDIPKIKHALLPSYCCDSMIEPFRDAGIKVSFYPVNFDNGLKISLNPTDDIDVVFLCNYFGYELRVPDLTRFIQNGGVIIEDITHSFFSEQSYHDISNYIVASIRKWEPVYCGGYCAKVDGFIEFKPFTYPPDEFLNIKKRAMKIKSKYLFDNDINKKNEFLPLFTESNCWLKKNYSGLMIDDYSKEYLNHVDIKRHILIRKENAKVLYNGLAGKVNFMFPETDLKCPLFVPVILKNRDQVRKKLIENRIYCPIHWPKPQDCSSNIYDLELSLICDQRYNVDDMQRIVATINDIL